MKKLSDYESVNTYYNDVYKKHLHDDIMENLTTNDIDFFRYRIKNKLLIKNIYILKDFDCADINTYINNYMGVDFTECKPIPKFIFETFAAIAQQEKSAGAEETNVFMTAEGNNRLVRYLKFLDSRSTEIHQIDRLNSNCKISYISNNVLINRYPEVKFINKYILDKKVYNILRTVDFIYLKNLQETFSVALESLFLSQYVIDEINNPELSNPIHLQEYPEEQVLYLKLVRTLFREHLYQKLKELEWIKLPKIYEEIQDLVNKLDPAKVMVQEVAIMPTTNANSNSAISDNYPKHIFKSQKDYDFFCYIAKKVTTSKQLSFLYRVMAEKENPAMILVKDTPFRNWFNSQTDFEIKLDYHTDSLTNATNKDKEWAYQAAKEIFYHQE